MAEKSLLYPRESLTRRVVDMSGMWNFMFDPKSEGAAQGWNVKLPSPTQIPVPAAFADLFTDKKLREYCGDFWYERDFYVPEEWSALELSLRFGAAAHRAIVYINGKEAGFHEGGFLPFSVSINDFVKFNQPNRLSVKVNNELREDCLPVGTSSVLPDGSRINKGYFDFFNYSGLLRPVKLTAVPKEHIVDFSVKHELLDGGAEVEYIVKTTGANAVAVTVFDANGTQVASYGEAEGTLSIPSVHLWDVLKPYLYKFVFRITNGGGRIIDEYAEEIGIRKIEVVGEEILLNDKPVYLKGFGKHEESDIIGRAYNPGVIKRDFELMKWCGANSFRTAHYPYSEEIYQLADKEGFLVIDETPAVGLMASTLNFFDAAAGGQTAFFEKATTAKLLENHLDALEDLINRDKNHACVIAWSLLNEPETTDDAALPYLKKVFERALELDPQKRPRTFASIMSAQPNKCMCYQLCDIIALNRYYGWYVFGGSEIVTAELALRHELEQWKAKSLDKPFVFTEYGADAYAGEHKLPSVMWGEEYQTEYLKMNHRVFDAYDFIKGEQVWAFADFATGEGTMRVDGNKKGVFTRQRQPKAAAYYLKERWEELPEDYKSKKEGGVESEKV